MFTDFNASIGPPSGIAGNIINNNQNENNNANHKNPWVT